MSVLVRGGRGLAVGVGVGLLRQLPRGYCSSTSTSKEETQQHLFDNFKPHRKRNTERAGAKNIFVDTLAQENLDLSKEFDPKDRTRVVPWELSVAYMESDAYVKAYGDLAVWQLYRRNYAHGKTYKPTRKSCTRHGDRITTGSPCPICRYPRIPGSRFQRVLVDLMSEPCSNLIGF